MHEFNRLDPDRLVAAAIDATGLDDFGAPEWREGLEQLAGSLTHEAALSDLGRVIAEEAIVGDLGNRLRVVAHRTDRPEISDLPVSPPIVIVGQGRTGTTILFDLLAQDPATRVPLTWETDHPCPPPRTATYDSDPRIATVDERLDALDVVLPGFRAMHPMGARLAQECVRVTVMDFRSMQFPTQYRIPSYTRWLLDEADMASAYRWHRFVLQHLASEHPASRWVVKSPGHIWCLDALLAEYPDALLVQTHRDPLRIIASIGSLVAKLRSLASDDTSIPAVSAEFADYIVDGLDRSVTARTDGTIAPDRVIDVQFHEFMADPFGTIRTVYERLGLEFSAAIEAQMRGFLAEHPQDKFGGHRYTWAATELDEGEWRDRVERYVTHFDVMPEPLP